MSAEYDYNNYMNKFSSNYKITKDEDGIKVIKHKSLKITVSSPEKQLLSIWAIETYSLAREVRF